MSTMTKLCGVTTSRSSAYSATNPSKKLNMPITRSITPENTTHPDQAPLSFSSICGIPPRRVCDRS
jgi:hypothetical protein